MELKIKYAPISLGKLRIWSSLHHSLNSMKDLGMESLMILFPFCGNILLVFKMWLILHMVNPFKENEIIWPEILWPCIHALYQVHTVASQRVSGH